MRLLQEAIAERARARPEATAVVADGVHISYGDLDAQSSQLAHVLRKGGCLRGDRVALFMRKQPAAVLGILGTLKAGAAYVVLDPADPAERLARVLRSAQCSWVLGAGDVSGALHAALQRAELGRPPLVGWLDDAHAPRYAPSALFTRRDLDVFPVSPPVTMSRAQDLAQILFTSGSTGTPKGVMIEHASILHFLRWAGAYFGITSADRLSQHAPLRFDLSTFDVFGALSNGAELHLVPSELNLLPHRLAAFIRDHAITQWLSVPAVLNFMAKHDVIERGDFPELKRVLFAGEVMPMPTLIHWMSRVPHASFTNLYGPTETTIASSYYTVPRRPVNERERIPIGRACEGEELLILDERFEPVPVNEVGDLYIRGAGVTRGYWRDEEKTHNAFLRDPHGRTDADRIYKTGDRACRDEDGLVYFCGRADTQIKTRGYRVELGEIEAALHTVPALREAAVLALESGGFEGHLICCAFAPAPDGELSELELRARLAELVPSYMLPTRWLRYDALPKNCNGKIDRAELERAFVRAQDPAGTDPAPERAPSLLSSFPVQSEGDATWQTRTPWSTS